MIERQADPFAAQSLLMELAGLTVETIVDGGAFVGEITERYLSVFPSAHVWAFEPTQEALTVLANRFSCEPRVTVVPAAIAASDGFGDFNINDAPATNSLLHLDPNHSPYLDYPVSSLRTISVRTVSLDAYCTAQGISRVSILKLDIQGTESSALQGASDLLRSAAIDMVFTELNFVPVYQGQTPTWEVLRLLGDYGYRLFDIFNLRYGDSGQLKWGDALFPSPQLREMARI